MNSTAHTTTLHATLQARWDSAARARISQGLRERIQRRRQARAQAHALHLTP